jgi:hypothetical protein
MLCYNKIMRLDFKANVSHENINGAKYRDKENAGVDITFKNLTYELNLPKNSLDKE